MTGRDPSHGSLGFHQFLLTIDEIVDGYAYGTDDFNVSRKVPMGIQRAKGSAPLAGEQWLITKDLGPWTFAAIMSNPGEGGQLPYYTSPGAGITITDDSTDGIIITESGDSQIVLTTGTGGGVQIGGEHSTLNFFDEASYGGVGRQAYVGSVPLSPGSSPNVWGPSNPAMAIMQALVNWGLIDYSWLE